jgi:drug/metabolite transporter (DMT)-like permease
MIPDPHARNATLLGIGLMLASVFAFSLNNVLGKWMVGVMPVGQFLFLRSVAGLLLLAPFLWQLGGAAFRSLARLDLHVLRMTLSAVEIGTFYFALSYLPLADTMTFWLATPIYVTALSALFMGETVGWRRWVAILVGFCGVLLAIGPSSASFSLPALVGVTGAVIYAFVLLTTRRLRDTPTAILAAGTLTGAGLFGLMSAPFGGWIMPDTILLLVIVLIAGLFAIGLLLGNLSLRFATPSVATPFQYTQIIWGAALGYLAFGDVPHIMMIAGAILIIGAGLYIFLRERALGKQALPVEPP